MTWRAWFSDADGGVRTSILTAQTTPAPDLTRRVTPQNPRSQHYHHDFAEALLTGHPARGTLHTHHAQREERDEQGAQHRSDVQQADDRGVPRPVGGVVPRRPEADPVGEGPRRDGRGRLRVHGDRAVRLLPQGRQAAAEGYG